MRRCEGPLGAIVPPGADLVRDGLTYSPAEGDPTPPLPHRLAHGFRLPPGPRWAWEGAPPFTLDSATLGELRLYLEAVHADLSEGDRAADADLAGEPGRGGDRRGRAGLVGVGLA